MTERLDELAGKVVDTFRGKLSDAALAQISDAQFEDLTLMIREALGEQLAHCAERLDGLARELERQARALKPDLGL